MASAKRKPDVAAYLVALVAIAVIAIVALAAITQHRQSYASEMLLRTTTPVAATTDGMVSLAHGVSASATTMAQRLGSDRSAAIVAGDAAVRAADVGRYAAVPEERQQFESALSDVMDARRNVQNGRDPSAIVSARRAASAFMTSPRAPDSTAVDTRQSVSFSNYNGATLIDSRGAVIGYVKHLTPSQDGNSSSADVVLGGAHHLLGLLNLGGTDRSVPVSSLVFGEPHTVGEVLVVLINAPAGSVANVPRH